MLRSQVPNGFLSHGCSTKVAVLMDGYILYCADTGERV